MTIYEQIKKVMEGKNGVIITSNDLKNELKKKYGTNINSVVPSDFCYNRVNDGIKFEEDTRLFKYLGRGKYEYLGENYPYTGEIYRKPQGVKEEIIVGRWINGKLE